MKNYKIFISHSWTYVDELKKLRNCLEESDCISVDFIEESPVSTQKQTSGINIMLRDRILASDVVLGVAGAYASYSDWMDLELSAAAKNGINVVGVIPHGAKRISSTVNKYSLDNINWNMKSIIDAIGKYAK